jgi:hypothetical protein
LFGAIAFCAVVAKRSWRAVQLQAVAVLATTEATPVLACGAGRVISVALCAPAPSARARMDQFPAASTACEGLGVD